MGGARVRVGSHRARSVRYRDERRRAEHRHVIGIVSCARDAEDDEGGAVAKAALEREASKKFGGKGVGYGAAGTVEGAGLYPSALVTLKWTDANTDGESNAIADRLMATAAPLE